MCGIFGVVLRPGASMSRTAVDDVIRLLYKLSETRGREAAGIAIQTGDTMRVHRVATAASEMIASDDFNELVAAALDEAFESHDTPQRPIAVIGHSRLVTNGLQGIGLNNQPIARGDLALVHNGIVVNVDAVWAKHPDLQRTAEVDSEVIAALIEHAIETGEPPSAFLGNIFGEIEGETNIAVLTPRRQRLVLATNTGSLYRAERPDLGVSVFVSELYIAQQVAKEAGLAGDEAAWTIEHISAGNGLIVDIDELTTESISLTRPDTGGAAMPAPAGTVQLIDTHRAAVERRDNLRRCTRCVMPETTPYIEFDDDGVCNYCEHHEPITYRGAEALEEILAPHRKGTGEPDCIVAFSGGRDSCYALHLMVEEFGMRPLAYTYDWGMVTDLARRNQARMCATLGVEHIWISADIAAKRANIRRNVNAWLKSPKLGLIPLFIAGDKHFFQHANRLQKQTGLELMVLAENRLERTDFKTGFCGVPPKFERGKGSYQLDPRRLAKMTGFYGGSFLSNPRFLNRSLFDTATAAGSYYMLDHDYLWLFHYLPWDEETVDETLIGTYDWERATDTDRTWRIGDGTAAFYNYIFHTVAGFTEFDTFRSNQIREGVLTREEALALLPDDNAPRFDSILEYCQTIGVSFDKAMQVINEIPKLY